MSDDAEGLTLDQRRDLRELEAFLNQLHDPFLAGHEWDTRGHEQIIDRLCRRLSAEREDIPA